MDTELVRYLQQASPALDAPMRVLSLLGAEDFFQVLIPLVLWIAGPVAGLRALFMLAVAGWFNAVLKWAFAQPRPYWIDPSVRALSSEPTYGLPSGHAQLAAALWGLIAMHARRGWVWLAAAVLVGGIGFSRVYLGVHDAPDVLAGIAAGAGCLAAWRAVEPRAARWLSARGAGALAALAFGASLVLLLGATLARAAFAPAAAPAEWAAQALTASGAPIDPRTLDNITVAAAAVAGGGAGYALARATARFDPAGTLAQIVGRLVIGFIVLAALRFGLGAIFPREPEAVGAAFRYARYVVMLLWAVWGAPWVFLKLKLARPA